ncbi:MAG: TolC family protein [Vulcanimicrobiaceae bacterium]
MSGAFAAALFLTVLGSIAPAGAASTAPKHLAQTTPAPQATPAATPSPLPTVKATTLPYPAYGTPAPGAAQTSPSPTIPQQITLAQAIAIAAAKSPVLAQARAQLALSKGQYDLAKTPLLPNIFGTGSIDRISGSGTRSGGNFGTGTGTGTGTVAPSVGSRTGITTETLTLNLQQLIYNGGLTVAQIHSAAYSYNAAGNTYERNLQQLAFNVGQAYYTVLAAHYQVLVAAQVVQQDIVQENLVRAQIKAGTEARSNLLATEVPTAQARVTLVRAQGTEISAEAAFANALGLDANTAGLPVDDARSKAPETLLKAPLLDYNTAVTRALALRPDYVAAAQQVNSAKYSLKAAKLGRAPSLSGNAATGTASTGIGGGSFTASSNIGATLTIPIFNQGITNAQIEQAQAQLDNANAFLTNTTLTIQLNVRQALAGLISAEAAVAQTQVELANALEQVKATQAQYKAGVTTLPLLLQAQTNLTTAQTDRLTAIYNLRQAEQTYLFSLGESDLMYMVQ